MDVRFNAADGMDENACSVDALAAQSVVGGGLDFRSQ
jgi:hypothetical protein